MMMMIYNHHQSTPLQFGITGNHEMVGMKCFFQQERGKLSEKKRTWRYATKKRKKRKKKLNQRFADERTADGDSLWQNSDGSHGGVLQLVDGTVLGPPAVWTDPQEVTHLLRSLTGVQDPPVFKHTPSLSCLCVRLLFVQQHWNCPTNIWKSAV